MTDKIKPPLTIIILTFNEEVNLPAALESVVAWGDQVFVVDSFSTDKTLEIARKYEAQIYRNIWVDWATQRNWALDNLPIKNEWVLFLDADERVSSDLVNEISEILPIVSKDVAGFYINRRFIFLDRWLKHGGHNPNWVLRLVRRHKTRVLSAGDNEYFKVEGKVLRLRFYMLHEDKKGIVFFTDKHNKISKLAAYKLFSKEKFTDADNEGKYTLESKYRVWIRENILYKLPLFCRPFCMFFYRYFFRFGFLDGIEGFIYYFLHDFWYPFLVDSKILEIRSKAMR